MSEFVAILKEFGPFLLPLCVGMAIAVRWLVTEKTRLEAELKIATADSTSLREKRADDLEKSAREYAEFGEAVRNVMREWTEKIQAVLNSKGGR